MWMVIGDYVPQSIGGKIFKAQPIICKLAAFFSLAEIYSRYL